MSLGFMIVPAESDSLLLELACFHIPCLTEFHLPPAAGGRRDFNDLLAGFLRALRKTSVAFEVRETDFPFGSKHRKVAVMLTISGTAEAAGRPCHPPNAPFVKSTAITRIPLLGKAQDTGPLAYHALGPRATE